MYSTIFLFKEVVLKKVSTKKPAIPRFGTNLVYVDHLTYNECRIALKVGKPEYASQDSNNAGMTTT